MKKILITPSIFNNDRYNNDDDNRNYKNDNDDKSTANEY